MRMIDADRLLNALNSVISDYTSEGKYPDRFGIDDAINLVEDAPTLTPLNEWISVEERLPEGHMQVLMWSARWKIAEAGSYYNKHFWVYTEIGDGYIADNITHWMPLPAPPNGSTEKTAYNVLGTP